MSTANPKTIKDFLRLPRKTTCNAVAQARSAGQRDFNKTTALSRNYFSTARLSGAGFGSDGRDNAAWLRVQATYAYDAKVDRSIEDARHVYRTVLRAWQQCSAEQVPAFAYALIYVGNVLAHLRGDREGAQC